MADTNPRPYATGTGTSSEESDPGAMSRRRFLSRSIFAIGGFIGGVISLPAIGHFISPALKSAEVSWIEVGSTAGFTSSQPKKVDYMVYKADGWIEEPSSKSCWVIKKSDSTFIVYDPRCTHLGCPYAWHPESNQFICPCHTGIFDLEGNVVSGPPPRSLRRFANKIEGGKLFVREDVINA
ncbi:MAG: ubiquinol-cytochrome c reductase iron-sulfur subunit [Dehalococcoidia bacterium]|nr:ubiquinol-cytochrome c reductase iron-sulfur subunit [Dehalococcoidia bacterium]